MWLALCATAGAPAQPPVSLADRAAPEAEIRAVRERLQKEQPNLAPEELDRCAAFLARSNHLARLLVQVLERPDFTGALQLLEEFPGSLDELKVFGEPPLFRAIEHDQAALLEALLKRGANPNLPGREGRLPLQLAIERQRWDLALALLRAGADANATEPSGRTPLGALLGPWWGAWSGGIRQRELLSVLLEHGANPFTLWSANAASGAVVEVVLNRVLPGQFGDLADLLLTNSPTMLRHTPSGETALHLAALWARTNALEFLLDAGWNVNKTNLHGLTPLQTLVGAFSAPGQAIQFVVNQPVPPGTVAPPFILSAHRPFSSIPPVTMSRRSAPPSVPPALVLPPLAERLLARGAALDIFSAAGLSRLSELEAMLRENPALANARDGVGRTPLHYSVFAGRIATTRRLLDAGADPSAAMTKPLGFHAGVVMPIGTTPLHLAARINSVPLLRMLLAAKANPTLADANGDTPLHVAAMLSDTNCVALLLAVGAPLNRTNNHGLTPLRTAVLSGAPGNVALLLRAGAKPDIGSDGTSPVHVAAERNRIDVLPILLQHGLPPDAPDAHGYTPLLRAVSSRAFDALSWLYDRGANVNAADTNGNTALHLLMAQPDDRAHFMLQPGFWDTWKQRRLTRPGVIATTLRKLIQAKLLAPPRGPVWTNVSLTAWLLDHGANPNATNRAGQTPLHLFPFQTWWLPPGNPIANQLARLLRAGARVDVPDAAGETPLHRAAQLAQPETLALLLDAAARPARSATRPSAVNIRDAAGRTPLFRATENPRFAATNLSLLLAHGADPNLCDTGGVALLHRILGEPTPSRWPPQDSPSLTRQLLQCGAKPTLADARGRTPLHWLAAGQNPHTLTDGALLLAHGADPNARDREGFTPLHFALTNRHGNVRRGDFVKLLLTHGAFPDATNALGQTPLFVMAHSILDRDFFQGASEALRALLEAGANPASRDTNGQTFLHLLIERAGGWGNIREIVGELLGRHSELANLTNAAGDTLLHTALRANNYMFVQWLLERGADVTRRNAAGESPLLLAARQWNRGYMWQVRPPGVTDSFWNTLLRRDFRQFEIWLRAEPRLAEVPFRDGQPPLAFALKQRLTNFVNLLLELGAPLDPVSAMHLGRTNELRAMLQTSNPIPFGLLADAVRTGQFEALADLAAARGELRSTNPCDHSLLRVALEQRRSATADWLREHGVTLTLHDAVELGDTNELRRLLATNRAALDQPCPHGRTLLAAAARAKRPESARALLDLGAKPDARGERGWTPLHVAAMWSTRETAELLLDAGADVNARDEHGLTPMHHAARAGHTQLAALLLKRGADVNAPTTHAPDEMVTMPAGATPLHWAAHAGRLEVVRLLLEHGANAALTNALGQTPLALVRTNAADPHYRYGWVTFAEPPPEEPARAQIARLLAH